MSVIKSFCNLILGDSNKRIIKKYQLIVNKINSLEAQISSLTDSELKQKTDYFKQKISSSISDKNTQEQNDIIIKKMLNDILPEAFAVVREASKRVLGMRHFDVQLIGGIALHDGNIAEMSTGEGKTLVATLPSYLNALTGKGVHVITVNDYLVKRDSEWMGKVHKFLGLSVGCIVGETPQEERKNEYKKDIVYVTNSEIGFDYLRDNMRLKLDEMCLIDRGFNYAIVDEVDSILIDESRTPLIISGPTQQDPRMYVVIDKIVKKLNKDDYEINEKRKNVQLTDKGNQHIETLLREAKLLSAGEELYNSNSFSLLNFILQSLRANTLFHNGVDYIVKNNEVLIIDEFTGRIMDGRRYGEGLHQAIEAKEGTKIEPENQTLASITYQNFFRMYKKLSGMTGTAKTEEAEFFDIYKLPIITIPTNKPIQRKELDDLIFSNEDVKFNAIVERVKEANKKGQPVLIGTISIEKSEKLSNLLKKEGIKHNLLNAKYHEQEAEIIAEAGKFGAVTIATNMAGRGTDIMLGGNIQKEIDRAIEKENDLINNSQNSEKSDISNTIKGIQSVIENKKNDNYKSLKDDQNTQNSNQKNTRAFEISEKIREQHKEEYRKVVEAGGLLVIGSERHESRRIDNQLKGRSGRQGDPGETQFYLSLKDNLLRSFGGDKIDLFLSKIGYHENEVINHPMLNSVINKSQKKIEEYNYEIRKNLLKYDNVVNEQRQIIYNQRMLFVKSTNINSIFKQMVNDVNTDIVARSTNNSEVDIKQLKENLQQTYLFSKNEINLTKYDDIDKINKFCMTMYANKYLNIDLLTLDDIKRLVFVQTLDECWREHLYYLDHIKEAIHLRAYAHQDPLSEYKMECYNLMQKTMNKFIYFAVGRIFNVDITSNSE